MFVKQSCLVSGDANKPIAIVIVVQNTVNKEQYEQAQSTVECYAAYHRYPFHLVVVDQNASLSRICPQKDFMFQRHCVVAQHLSSWAEEWLLFIDADMAVVNPNHLIEEYVPMDPNVHIVFYKRIFNHEIMAGSYLIRNSKYSYDFLMHWSEYEYKLPKSFHGSDNGAIHVRSFAKCGCVHLMTSDLQSAVVSFQLPSQDGAREKCEKLWMVAKDYDTLSIYEVCMQMILSSNPLQQIVILEKGAMKWARDGWLTNSAWSVKDFILHGWQKRRKDKMHFARWHSPLVDSVWNPHICKESNAYFNWRYKDSFIKSNDEIQRILNATIITVDKDFQAIRKSLTSLE
ncbi:unnamed protein product [Heligmosomoides polygyrus]|uniref:Nucleotide-diphospho-sugar transferase domain-containing protein n=1 Tax=Heligmosomoides polygyrus TaxID=6339 RepID=A0A3P7X372_HELPZ|nr:unnamed protein product [Heligmosomoides polygyrus]